MNVKKVMVICGLVNGLAECRRLILQGDVSVNGEIINDTNYDFKDGDTLRVCKSMIRNVRL